MNKDLIYKVRGSDICCTKMKTLYIPEISTNPYLNIVFKTVYAHKVSKSINIKLVESFILCRNEKVLSKWYTGAFLASQDKIELPSEKTFLHALLSSKLDTDLAI